MTRPTLGDIIRAHRARKNLNQEEFADLAGLSGTMISHVEQGKRSLSKESAERVMQVFGLDAADRATFMAARDESAARLGLEMFIGASFVPR